MIVTREFSEKANEFEQKYKIRFQDAYEILARIGLQYGFTHLKERIFHPNEYYTNVYRIVEEKICLKQQSGLEKISNETNQR
jgi:hypothetical protein